MRRTARRRVWTAWLLASLGVLMCSPPAFATTGARNPALERDADALVTTTERVYRAIDRWRAQERPATERPPLAVELAALAQQRLVIRLTARPRRAEAVLARVRGPLRRDAVATVRARLALRRLGPPPPRPLSALVPARADRLERSAAGT